MWLGAAKFGARTLRELADKGPHHAARAGGGRRGADLPLAPPERAALLLGAQERRARPRPPAADREEPRLRERRDRARGRAVHAGLLPARPRDPPRVAPTDRALPGDTVAARLRGAAPAPAGAGRRARVLRRAAPSRRPRPRSAPGRADAAHEGLLASASAGLRAVARPRARARGLALPRGRRVPALARRARPVPRHLPDVGTGGADASRKCTSSACWGAICRSSAR